MSSTDGEEVVKYFLDEEGFNYKHQYELLLDGDTSTHRRADFFLPRYSTVVEFYGKWNSDNKSDMLEYRKRSKLKMSLYSKNKYPVVNIWPDNLGVLNFLFYKRLEDQLRYHNKKGKIVMLRLKKIIAKERYLWVIVSMGIFGLFFRGWGLIFGFTIIPIIEHFVS